MAQFHLDADFDTFGTHYQSFEEFGSSYVDTQSYGTDDIAKATIADLKLWLINEVGYTPKELDRITGRSVTIRDVARIEHDNGHIYRPMTSF